MHPLGADVHPVPLELLVRHLRPRGPLPVLQPLLGPPAEFGVAVEGRPRRVHVQGCAHEVGLPSLSSSASKIKDGNLPNRSPETFLPVSSAFTKCTTTSFLSG